MAGKITKLSENLKKQFRNPNLSKAQLYELMNEFIQAVGSGNYAEKGWARSCYGTSKIGINHYARVLAKEKDVVERKIQVYALCPGWVDTDMTSHKGPLTIQQGALTPVFLAELPFEVNP
jgi:NAD(P)-dependent dehydrogenase (short-subunit alcohol dehydrogenase family)